MALPNFNWGLILLLLLAFLSHYATPFTPTLLAAVWWRWGNSRTVPEANRSTISAQVFELIAQRLGEYRQTGGYGEISVYVEEIASGL